MKKNNEIKLKHKPSDVKSKFGVFDGITLAVLILFVSVFIILMLWGIIKSFEDGNDGIFFRAAELPKFWRFENYLEIIQGFKVKVNKYPIINGVPVAKAYTAGIAEIFYNTVIYTLGGAFVSTLCPCLVAYAVAKFRKWKISKIIYGTVLVTMIIPLVGTAAASISIARAVGVYDSLWGNMLQKFNFLGVYFLLFHASYVTLAKDYTEAAYLDGANEWRVFFSIIFPLVKNLFGTIMLIKFVEFWNDFNTVLIYLPSHPTLAYATFKMSTAVGTAGQFETINMRLASAMVLFFPMVIVFSVFQKKLMGNLSMGGVKE